MCIEQLITMGKTGQGNDEWSSSDLQYAHDDGVKYAIHAARLEDRHMCIVVLIKGHLGLHTATLIYSHVDSSL